ncbi:MAG: two-component regulator propeller domain-containing protein [Dysgonomonas sp.]
MSTNAELKMLKYLRFTVVLLYVFACTSLISAKNNDNYYFKRISIEQGLSQSNVTCILRDSRGILWIGTKSGLNCFDGNDLKIYFHKKGDKNSLSGDYIYMLLEDDSRNIWVSTNGGLIKYNRIEDNFTLETADIIYSAIRINNSVLFGGRRAFYKYNQDNKKVERLPFILPEPTTDNKDYNISEIFLLNENTILFGTKDDGIYTFDIVTHKVTRFIKKDFQTLLSMFVDQNRNIYVSTFKEGLFCFNSDGHLINHYTTQNSNLSNDIILDIIENEGNIWLATDGGGINILDASLHSIIRNIQHVPGDINSIPVNSVTVLHKDQYNNLWAGSVRDGAFLVKKTYIKTYKDVALNSADGLSDKAVISFFEDEDKYLWIGTDGGGINKYNPSTDQFIHYGKTYGDKVVSITEITQNELLISLYGKGVFRFNKNNGQYIPFTLINSETSQQEYFSGFVPACHKIASGKIIILSRNVYVYDIHNNSFKLLKTKKGESISSLRLAYSDESKSFMTKGNKIYRLSNDYEYLEEYLSLEDHEIINSVCYDKKEVLWIGSNLGLSKYDIKTRSMSKVSTGLFDRVSYIFLDEEKRLWINASNTLFSYNIAENRFSIWEESDGFLPNEIYPTYNTPSKTNYIYMGGTNGFVRINKNIISLDSPDPKIELQDIILNGKSYFGNMSNESEMRLNWNYTSLNIKVNINGKDLFQRALVRFKIEGENNTSIVESYNNELNLASLSPGRYNIYASSTARSGTWSAEVPIITITVSPPWYKSSLFIFGMALLLIIATLSVMFYIIRRQENKMKWELAKNEQKNSEEKIQFLINVSHELRTPLTLIYAPLKRLLENTDNALKDDNIKNQLQNIFRQVSNMKNIINMVLDYDRISSGQKELSISEINLNIWIKSILEDFKAELDEKHIELIYELDEGITEVPADAPKCRIILSNLIMNAIKFSNENSYIKVMTSLNGNFVKIAVEDKGIGLSNVDINKLFSRFYQGNHDKKGKRHRARLY